MTNSEYITTTLSLFGIGQDPVAVSLGDSALNGDAYLDAMSAEKGIYKDFHLVRAAAHRNVSEGGFSRLWNACEKALKAVEKALADEVGDDPEKAGGYGCVDRSYMW